MAGKAKQVTRRKLEDFPCRYREYEYCYCWEGCDGFMDCDVGGVYREYLKLQKCARLLRVFMWWIARWKTWTSYGRRVRQGDEIEAAIRSALKEAGL